MKKGDNLSIILFPSMFSGRLGAFQALDTTRQRYSIGKAVYTGYNVSVSIKDIKNSPASFAEVWSAGQENREGDDPEKWDRLRTRPLRIGTCQI